MISSCLAWPLACTAREPEWTTSAPRRTGRRSPCETLVSLPGMACELRMTVSSGPELDPPVLAGGHQRQRRHRLALGAGGDDAHLGRVEVADVLDVDQAGSRGCCSRPMLAGQAHVLLHRQAEGGDDPAVGDGGVGDLLDAVDVAGEAGDDDALAGVAGEEVAEDAARPSARIGVWPFSSALVESASSSRMPSSWRARRCGPGRCGGRRPGSGRSCSRRSAGSRPAACGWRWRSRAAPSG